MIEVTKRPINLRARAVLVTLGLFILGFLYSFQYGIPTDMRGLLMTGAFGLIVAGFGILLVDRDAVPRGETVRQYIARAGRIAMAVALIFAGFSAPCMKYHGASTPLVIGAPVLVVLILGMARLNRIRCPRCQGSVGAITAARIALDDHCREDFCPRCRISLDEPRVGKRMPMRER